LFFFLPLLHFLSFSLSSFPYPQVGPFVHPSLAHPPPFPFFFLLRETEALQTANARRNTQKFLSFLWAIPSLFFELAYIFFTLPRRLPPNLLLPFGAALVFCATSSKSCVNSSHSVFLLFFVKVRSPPEHLPHLSLSTCASPSAFPAISILAGFTARFRSLGIIFFYCATIQRHFLCRSLLSFPKNSPRFYSYINPPLISFNPCANNPFAF